MTNRIERTPPVVHIAGHPVQIGSLYRQRCAWCGAILIDGDAASEMASTSDGQPHTPSKWERGALVEVSSWGATTHQSLVAHQDGRQLPDNACVGPRKKSRPQHLRVVRS